MTRIICIASGKGGVGKTTTVANIGSALNKFGFDTIIVDGNFLTPNLGLQLGINNTSTNLLDVLNNNKSIFESVYLHPNGTKVIPSSINMWGVVKLPFNKLEELNKLRGFCDLMLVDCAPGLSDDAKACIKASDEVVIVTNPEITSVTDSLKTVQLAKQLGKPVIGVVINKVNNKSYEMSVKNVVDFLGVPLLGVVPDDESVKQAISNNKTVIDSKPFSKASIGFKKVAARIIGQDYEDLEKIKFIDKIRMFFNK